MRCLTICTIVIASLCAAPIAAWGANPQVSTFAVAKTGGAVPGVSGATFSSFGPPTIGNITSGATDVVFGASVIGGGSTALNDEGIWKGGTASPLALQAREGSAAGSSGLTFASPFAQPQFGTDIGVQRTLFQSETNAGTAIWYQVGGTTSAVATTGQQAPGTAAGVVFGDGSGSAFPYRPLFDGSQNPAAAFLAKLSGPGVDASNNVGIWSGNPTGVALSLRTGQQVTNNSGGIPPAGLLYSGFSAPVGSPYSFGFKATVTGAGTTAASDTMVVSSATVGQTILGREGDYPFNSGLPFGGLVHADLSNAVVTSGGFGGVVWIGNLAGSAVNSSNDSVLWQFRTPIAREGSQAPGLPAGVVYNSFERPYVVSANSTDIGFTGTITGPGVTAANDKVLFSKHASNPFQLFAREGSQVPGIDPGITYADFDHVYFGTDGVNNLITMLAQLQGPGVDATNDFAMLQTLGDGSLAVIAREGFPLDLGGGDLRTVASLEWPDVGGVNEIGGTSISRFNRVTFLAHFTDGSSAVMVAVIPEPASATIIFIGSAIALTGRRRSLNRPPR